MDTALLEEKEKGTFPITDAEAVREETLRMAYIEICKSYFAVRATQVQLLTFLPGIIGVAVSLLMHNENGFAPRIYHVVGGLGACLTLGLFFYGVRADQHASALIRHGALLEKTLPECQFKDRPIPRFHGVFGYTFAFVLIYAALLTAWGCVIFMGHPRADVIAPGTPSKLLLP